MICVIRTNVMIIFRVSHNSIIQYSTFVNKWMYNFKHLFNKIIYGDIGIFVRSLENRRKTNKFG